MAKDMAQLAREYLNAQKSGDSAAVKRANQEAQEYYRQQEQKKKKKKNTVTQTADNDIGPVRDTSDRTTVGDIGPVRESASDRITVGDIGPVREDISNPYSIKDKRLGLTVEAPTAEWIAAREKGRANAEKQEALQVAKHFLGTESDLDAGIYSSMSLEEIASRRDNAKTQSDRNYFTKLYNQKLTTRNTTVMANTQMDGANHSVLHELNVIAGMEDGEEKKARKAAVLRKMEELGVDTSDYALYAGDSDFDLGTFGKWVGQSAKAGLALAAKGFADTADVIIGAPLRDLGWENNPFSAIAEHQGDVYEAAQYGKNLYAEKLGGGKGYAFAGDAIEGTAGAVPYTISILLTKGVSAAATTADLVTQAAYRAGNFLTKAGLTVAGMAKNPQFWMSFAQSYGQDYEEAKENGADDYTAAIGATVTSMLNAGVEIGIDGGSGFQGLPDDIAKGGKNAVLSWVESSLEEGGEEMMQKFISEMVTKTMYDHDAEILDPEEYMREGAIGTVSGLALGGGQIVTQKAANAVGSKIAEHEASKLTENEQKVVDRVYKAEVAKAEEKGKVTEKEKSAIYDRVLQDLERGNIRTETIEEILGGETYKAYKDTSDSEQALRDEFKTLNQMKNSDMTGEQTDRRDELKGIIRDMDTRKETGELDSQKAKTKLSEEVFGLVGGSRLAESYVQRAKRGEKFHADLSQYDQAQQETVRKAMESGILNNTRRTHEFVGIVAKISADKGVAFDFVNNEKLKETGFTIEGAMVDGYITKDGIAINMDSHKAWQSTVGHEVTHVLEKTELYGDLQKILFDYAKARGEYDSRLAAITELYEKFDSDADPMKELTADLVGEYLFTDADFVSRLSTENRNVFQKVFDEIKYLCQVATAGSKEARQLEMVRKTFEEVYRSKGTKNTVPEGGVRYALSASSAQSQFAYMKPFGDQLADFQNGSFPERDVLTLGGTPEVLKRIGLIGLPMTINQKHIGDALNGTYKGKQQEKLDHTFTAQELATLPEKLADPIAIIYDKRAGKARPSEANVDVIVEMKVASGKSVLAAVQVGGNGHINGLRIDTNKVSTVHGNTDTITRL